MGAPVLRLFTTAPVTMTAGQNLSCVNGPDWILYEWVAAIDKGETVTLTARAGTLESTSTGGFLFTHHGYSGPAVLDVSHVAVRSLTEMGSPARLVVSWTSLNDKDWETLRSLGVAYMLKAIVGDDEALKLEAIRLWRASLKIEPGQPNSQMLLRLIGKYSNAQ